MRSSSLASVGTIEGYVVDICTDPLDGTHKPAPTPQAAWPEVDELIRSGAYDRLGQLLRAHRDADIDAGATTRAAVLDAAEQLCLSCIELHRQQGDHYQAAQRAVRLEEDACLRLRRLMAALGEDGLPAELPPQPDAPPDRWAMLRRRVALALRRPNPEPPAPPVFLLPAPEPPAIDAPVSGCADGRSPRLHSGALPGLSP